MHRASPIVVFAAVRRRLKRERGVVALMTVAFLAVAGLVCVLLLWGIGYAAGAYNALYTATQNAAYAAVSTAVPSTSGNQPQFQCAVNEPSILTQWRCSGGTTYQAAITSLQGSLGTNVPGTFGLTFNPAGCSAPSGAGQTAVCITDNTYTFQQGQPQGAIEAMPVEQSPSAASAKCNFPPVGTAGINTDAGYGSRFQLSCWRLSELDQLVPGGGGVTPDQLTNYESGVVIRTAAQMVVPPFCKIGTWFCPSIEVTAVAGAEQSQPASPPSYRCYFSGSSTCTEK